MLEGVVEKDDVFIMAVGHQKAAGNHTQPGKAQLFVQVQRPFVAFDHGVKLLQGKGVCFGLLQAVLDQ